MVLLLEAISVLSGALIYGAMAVKNLIRIRALLLLGALGFLTYGIFMGLPSIIIVNSVGSIIGIIMLIKAIRAAKKA